MKAQLTLPERPSILHLLAVVDLLVVLLIFFTLIPAVARQSGMQVEPAEISFRLRSIDFDRAVSLTIKGGDRPQLFLETERIAFEDIENALVEAREKSGIKSVIVLADESTHWKIIPKLTLAIRSAGLSADWVGVPPAGEADPLVPGSSEANPSSATSPPSAADAPQP